MGAREPDPVMCCILPRPVITLEGKIMNYLAIILMHIGGSLEHRPGAAFLLSNFKSIAMADLFLINTGNKFNP